MDDVTFLPPHEATAVAGLHVYSHQLAINPGGELDLRVSNDGPVTIEILRHRDAIANAELIAALPPAEAQPRPLHRGSYVFVEKGLPPQRSLGVELWFRALADAPLSGLVDQGWFYVSLVSGNRPCFGVRCGNGTIEIRGAPLPLKAWHHLAAGFDGNRITLYADGASCAGPAAFDSGNIDGGGSLRLGALGNLAGEAANFFTGDLWNPSLYAAPLSASQITERFQSKAEAPAAGCLAQWKFDAVAGRPYRDAAGERHGRPVNYPIRLIPGPRRVEDSDWSTYDPAKDPDFGHAVRLMADALVDCRWPVTATWKAPADIQPGQYMARAANKRGESKAVHFIVRPNTPRARLLCLSTTSTRVAYNFQCFGDARLDYGAYQNHPSYPILGHLLGVRRPSGGKAWGDDWEAVTVDFELPFYHWLDTQKIPYDLYTEWDLEADPKLLDRYDAVAFAGHSEYWTKNQYEGLQKFVRRGGNIVSLSGNTGFWRVSIDQENGVMEVRKHERKTMPGATCDAMVNAAHWHQMDHLPGSYMYAGGWPEWRLMGVVTTGFTDPALRGPRAGYEVLRPEHALFRSPRRVETAGVFAPDAAGYEPDLSARSMFERFGWPKQPIYPARDGTPDVNTDPQFDAGLQVLARAKLPDSNVMDYNSGYSKREMWSEMTVWERPGMGSIFAAGSVLSSHILSKDANFSNFILNVLDRFGVGAP